MCKAMHTDSLETLVKNRTGHCLNRLAYLVLSPFPRNDRILTAEEVKSLMHEFYDVVEAGGPETST